MWKAAIVYGFRELLRILVTGGAGFVGSHLCERFVREGHEVVALDDLSGGTRENLSGLAEKPGFSFVEHDVCDPITLEADRSYQRIYHLACPASPLHYRADPLRTLRTCVLGTMHALDLAQRSGARFLLASTSEIYGDPLVHPQNESYWGNVNPIGPRACYDEGKRVAETFTIEFGTHRGVDVRIARIFNTYGPRMTEGDGRVVTTFVHRALRNETIPIHGDGSQTRSFCYIDDLTTGLSLLMEHDRFPGPVNLGNPEEVTMLELAKLVIAETGSTSTIVHGDRPPDDPARRCPDIALARKLLGFEPKVALRDGLAKTIAAATESLGADRRRARKS